MIIKDNKKINPIISDQEAKKRKVSLQTADGKNFGEISTSAHSAIRGNYLDRYSPTDDNEKKILDSYKEHVAALTPKAETEESTGRNATLRDLTINSLKRGYVQSLYGQESFKAMTGQKNKKAYYEEKLKSEDYSFIPDAWYEKALSGAMELLGQQVKQWTDNRSLAAGTAAAGAAAVAGQAGPQIALPEEIVTVPGAFFAGIAAGSATANFEIEAGLAYNEMIENGISQKTARKIALGVGAGNAALEAVQLDDLAKSFKILDTQDATKPVAKKLLSYLKDRGMNVASETAQEVAQEAVTITGANLGSKIDKGNWEYNWGEIGQRIGETAVSSAMSFGLLGTGGDVINHGLNRAASAISGKGKKTLGESLLAKHTKNESPALLQTLNDDIPADAAPIVNAKNETNTALSGKRQDPSSVSAIKLTETTETQPSKNTSVITEHQAENPTATADKNFKENLSAHNNAKSDFVSVGDTFKDVKTGNTVTVLGRDAENAKLQIDTGSKIETKEIPNNAIDKSIANGQLERIEIADQSEESIAKNQAYNITVSNLKRKAEDLGLTDSAFYSTLQNVNLYHPSENDKALINDEFRRIFSGNTDSLTASWLDSIANTASSTSPKNIHLTQVGDFYEAYGNEAIDIANKLNLTPTTKNVNGEKVQMVGFPVISLKRYAQALGNDYNISVSDTQSVNGRNMPARTENAVTNEGTTDTGVINHVKEVDGLKLINTEKSTLINGKTLITGVYELNSDKDFGRKSYRKEKFDYFRKSGNPWTETVNGTTYGHYGFYKYKDGQYIVEHLPTGMGITSVKTESKAKLLIKALDDNLPELPLNIKAFGDEYRCYGMTQEISVSIKNIINSANEPVVTEIQDGKVPFRTKAGLVDYVKTHIGDKVRVTFNNGASEVRTLESISNASMRTKKPDGSDSVTDLKGIKYNDNGFSVEYGTGVSVTYDFINTDETHESATEPTESVIKKADSVTETKYGHPYDEEKAGQAFINAVDEDMVKFIGEATSNQDDNSSVYIIGKTTEKLNRQIKELTGIDTTLFHHSVKANSIRHIIKDHGINGLADRSMSNVEDIARMGYVLRNFDDMELLNAASKEYRDKNQRPAKMVKLSKRIDGTYYVVEAVPDTNAKRLAVVSAYIKKAPVQQTENVQAPSSNVRNDSVDTEASNNIVSRENNIVNNSVRGDAKNDTHAVDNAQSIRRAISSIRKGESVSLEYVRNVVDALLTNRKEAIKAELSKLKNEELKKRVSVYDRGRMTKKADMVDSIYSDMISNLYYALSGKDTITYIYDGSSFDTQQSKMLQDVVKGLTQDSLNEHLADNAAKYQKQLAAREEKLARVKNPQTLDDYQYKRQHFGLSDKEAIQFENLYAEERRKAREDKKAAKTTKETSDADAFFANTDNYTIEKTTHTKTGDDVWVVRPTSRLETEQWKQLNEQMKVLGGSYWRGNQGWNFKKDPTAALSSTEETETVKGSTNIEKLRAVAEGMQKAIDDKFRDRLTNTAKRAREAASAEAEGERLKRLQDTINNIADALENGEDTLLDKIDSKAQVETLMSMLRTGRRNRISDTMPNISYGERLKEQEKPYSDNDVKYAEYPLTKLHENIVNEYIRSADGKTGYKQITDRLKKSLKSVKDGYITIDSQAFSDIDRIVKNLSTVRGDYWNEGVLERKRLARMGIENVIELRAYLREFINFLPEKDAEAERRRNIKAKERQFTNSKIEGFFPTPKAIVDKMLDEADIRVGEKVLEPSAGKGNIADAIREMHPNNILDVVEWNSSLNEFLSEKGHHVVGNDFLLHSGKYDKIIMNPPFEKGQDIDHIMHAYSLLNDGGRVVCIMSEGPFYRNDKKATSFRSWLKNVGGVSEKLPDGAFKKAERSTGVNTRLVVIDKTAGDSTEDVNPSHDVVEKKSQPHQSKPSVRSSKDVSSADHTDRWSTERITSGESNGKNKVTLPDIVNSIRNNYNIPISTGKIADREASGIYKEKPEVIRTRIANNLPTISHELGHHLDKEYRLSELDSVDELCKSVSKDFLEKYSESERPGEAVAEFVRTYLRNTNEANRLCSDFYSDFIKALSKKDLKSLNEIADSVNEYLSYNISDRYDAAIVSSKKKEKLPFRDKWHRWYSNWVDSFHPQKQVIDYVEDVTGQTLSGKNNAYILATNSLNAHTIANFLICEGFRDLDGNIIDAKSFVDSIGMVDSKNVKLLDKYLVLRHSLEWIAPEQEDVAKKRVFADDTLEDVDNIKKQIAKIEKKHPEIKTAAENLYEYQNNVLEHFVIPAGGMTDDTLRALNRMYPSYVPFYRAKGKKSGFAKGTFANQRSPIMRAKGSGEMIISPTESIIRNTEKMVKYALRNQVMQELANYADNVDGFGQFMEKVPPDMVPHTIDISGMKESFTDALQQVINSDKDYFAVSDLFEELFDDTVTDFTPVANANKRIVTVMRGGKPSYYQIHDEEFYKSVAELSPQQVSGLLKISQTIMQPMKILITQNNPIFAATNAIRDYGTAYKLSEINNPATFALKYIQALGGIVSNNDAYKQYKAMGGGHSSELSANIEDISKTLRRVAQKDMGKARRLVYAIFVHPVSTVAAINDAIESIPRFMEFQRTLESGGDLQQAIYNADDITTNFKKSGKGSAAKGVNKLFMFNNAAIQGLDKLFRTITDKDPKKRTKTIIKWVLNALIMGVIGWLWNKEVDEKGYENLSSYKKNNFYNFAIGDGKFISLPKPRENALLDTFTERTIEYLAGENKEAFYDFGNYLGSQLLPPMLPDTLDPIDAVHSVLGSTVMGGLVDIGFNQDFKGSPIESKYDEYLPSNERYTENTSKLAYTLGQTAPARAIDMSPKKIDHLISQYTGILGQANKALFPMNSSRRDQSIGLRNKFISDSNYSTDVLNKVYENEEKAKKAFDFNSTIDSAVEYERNAIVASYISGMNQAVKALPEEDQRTGRAYLLKSLNGWNYSNTASQKEMLRRLDDETISDRCVITGVPKSTIEWTKDKVKYSYQMTPQEYDEYVKDYLKLAEKYRTYQSKNNKNTADYTEALSKADTEVKKVLSKKYQQKYAGKAAKEAKK